MQRKQQRATQGGDWKKTQEQIRATRSELDGVNKKYDEATQKVNRLRDANGRFVGSAKDGLKSVNDELADTPKKAKGAEDGFDKIGKAIKTAFTATGILYVINLLADFGKKLIDITGTSEKYQNQFTRIFEGNSQAAKGYLSSLQAIADTTNYTFDELADNVAKIASRGIIPTKKELLGIGDVANFVNKDFTQLNEAILDANNSERWKELGFTVKTEGGKMTLAYGDFSKKVDATVKGAYEAITAFSELKKVQGSTAEAGATLSGRMSTLEDTLAGLFRTIGQGNTGVLNATIDLITQLIQGGIELYKVLAPSLDSVGNAFSGLGKAIGGVLESFGNFQTEAEKSATWAQQFGYYIEKFIVRPLTAITLVAAGTVEAFNLIAQQAQLLAAKISGDKSLQAAAQKQIDATMARLQELRAQGQQLRAERDAGLSGYVQQDNRRRRREERRTRLNEEETANFKPTDTGKPKTDTPDKAAESIATKLANERAKLVEEREKLNEKLRELQDKAEKERIESLDKNSQEYIALKRKYDLEEIEQERKKLIELGQQATGTPYYDKKLKKVVVTPNANYKLPSETEAMFQARKDRVNQGADRDAGRLAEDQFENDRKKARKEYNDAEAAYDRDQANNRRKIAERSAALELELREKLFDQESTLTRKAGESEVDFERRKNEELLKLRLEYYDKLLKLAEADPSQKDQILGLKETILGIRRELKAVQAQASSGPSDLFDLLGIKFSNDADQNDKLKSVVGDATKTVIDGANQILTAQINADQARIESIDRQLDAKQREVETEAQLAAAGLANNLATKKQERAQLEAERKKAIEKQRQDQAIQIALNAVLQASNMALAIAQSLAGASKLPPPFGLIAAGAQVIGMLALFASSIAQVRALPKYHDGDEVTHETARRRSLGNTPARPDEVDARLQVGEGVMKRDTFQANKPFLTRLNKLGRQMTDRDLSHLLEGTGVTLPDQVKQSDMLLIQQANESRWQPDRELHGRIDQLNNQVSQLIEDNRRFGGEKRTLMPDGSIRIEDARGNVRIERIK